MSTVLAVANQKGGVARTTTVASLGAALAEQGAAVLLVDLDPQATHARAVLESASEVYALDVIEPPIPKTIRFAEAPAAGRSLLRTSTSNKGARAYREVAKVLAGRGAGGHDS